MTLQVLPHVTQQTLRVQACVNVSEYINIMLLVLVLMLTRTLQSRFVCEQGLSCLIYRESSTDTLS